VEGDGEVQHHGLEPPGPEVAQALDVARINAQVGPAHRLEQALGGRGGKGAHRFAFEQVHPLEAGRLLARDDLLRIDEVRPRHGDAPLILRSQLQAVEEDVEVAALEGGDKLVPLILDHAGLDPEPRGQGLGQFALEADHALGPLRVRIDVGRAALGIGAPEQHAALTDLLEGIRRQGRRAPAAQRQSRQEAAKRHE